MKKLIIIGLLLAIIGGGVSFMIYNKPHQDMKSAQIDLQLSASDLFSQFESDEAIANTQYLDKVIAIEGQVQSVSKDKEGITNITLDAGGMLGGVICKLDVLSEHKRTEFTPGETVKIKGICTGMLMDVVLVRCVEI